MIKSVSFLLTLGALSLTTTASAGEITVNKDNSVRSAKVSFVNLGNHYVEATNENNNNIVTIKHKDLKKLGLNVKEVSSLLLDENTDLTLNYYEKELTSIQIIKK